MRRVFFGLCALGVLATAASAQQTTSAQLPVEAFGRLPAVSDAALSPDGTKLVMAMTIDSTPSVVIFDLTTHQRVFGARTPQGTQLRGVGWADEGHATYVVSQALAPGQVLPRNYYYRGGPRRVEFWRNGIIDVNARTMMLISTSTEAWRDQNSELVAPIEGDPGYGRMIGRATAEDAEYPTVYRINLDNGQVRIANIRGANPDTIGFLLDSEGDVLTRFDSDERTNRWTIFVYDDETPRPLLTGTSDTGSPPNISGELSDGRLVSVSEDDDSEFYMLYAVDRRTGQRSPLWRREGQEVENAITDPWSRRIVGVEWIETETKQEFFVPALQDAYTRVVAQFNGAARLMSWSRDHSRVLVYGERGLDGGGYYLFTPSDGRLERLALRYPEVAAAARTSERQAITYRARDGTRIPAYLTTPSGADGRNLPLVVLVHGGPHSRDTMDFDWWAAFLASRGYAVLQPNYRGSSGYGATWQRAGMGQWGGLMQTDVEDGVEAMVRSGMADAARICIVGASYGGYAALAGATLTPDRYKCAVSVAGVSDLVEFTRTAETRSGSRSAVADFWRLSIGDRQEDRDRLRGVSPALLADRVQAPILLIHGTDDTVVPIAQSRRMRDRLNAEHKNVRYVELRGDDHWLSDAETRIQMLREIDTFLAQNLGSGQ
ncbi:alpha/beta hydrolase family protein [Terricaulis sp.]|uniref:alpha/beta hydrolase family protein n=1 Tax=Terricaulis sp. TaxID=2768686 RepID=UPI0037835D7A